MSGKWGANSPNWTGGAELLDHRLASSPQHTLVKPSNAKNTAEKGGSSESSQSHSPFTVEVLHSQDELVTERTPMIPEVQTVQEKT